MGVGQWNKCWFSTGLDFDNSIQNNKMNQVNNLSVANNEISFTWVTFGDNDSIYNSGDGADCWHTRMSFTVEVELANKSLEPSVV